VTAAASESVNETRFCRVLVISPQLRTNHQSDEYKPFQNKRLLTLFDDVARDVEKHHRSPLFEKHALYSNFFFGAQTVEKERIWELRALPSSIVECAALDAAEQEPRSTRTDSEHDAKRAAAEALKEFMYDEERRKTLVLVCKDHCEKVPPHNHHPTFSDTELFHALWTDLVGNLFAFAGKEWARRG
jgi:hypothetical protein